MVMDSTEVWETLIRLVSNEISLAEAHSLITGEVKQTEKTSIAVCPRCGNGVINLSQGTYCLNSECEYQEEKILFTQKRCTKNFDKNLYGDYCKEKSCSSCLFFR